MAVRSQRNNNPGNIRTNSTAWEGKVGDDGSFVTFATPEHGVRAMVKTLYTYQQRHGKRTLREIISRWAPPNENSTATYISIVSKETGINPDQPIDLRSNPKLTKRLVNAMIRMEGGNSAVNYFKNHVDGGISMANGERTAPANIPVGDDPLPPFQNPNPLEEVMPENAPTLPVSPVIPEGVGSVESSPVSRTDMGTITKGNLVGNENQKASFSSMKFDNMKEVLSFLEQSEQFWDNELDEYQNYSYNLELFIPPSNLSAQFLDQDNDNFEQVINNQWPPTGTKYITIAKTATTTEFNIDNLQIKSMGEGSGSISKLVGTAVNISFDITQVGNTSLNDTLFGAAMLMGYASLVDVVYYMKITFKGYDLNSPENSTPLPVTKIIPFMLNKINDIPTTTNETGTMTTLEGVVVQDLITSHAVNTTEYEFEVKIKETLQETLKELETKLNEQEIQNNLYDPDNAEQARFLNTYVINTDDVSLTDIFKNSKMNGILANKSSGTNDVETRTNSLNVASQSAKVTPGISIIDLIYDICIQSVEIREELLKEKEVESFVPRIESVVVPKDKGFNPVTGASGNTITYNIIMKRQIITQNQHDQLTKLQEIRKLLDDIYGRGRARKVYYYHYTGLNDQILDLTISLNRQLIKTYNTPKDSWLWHNFVKPGTDLYASLTEKQQAKFDEIARTTRELEKNKKTITSDLEQKASEITDGNKDILQLFKDFRASRSSVPDDGLRGNNNSVNFANLENNLDNPNLLATLQQMDPELFAEFNKSLSVENAKKLDEHKKLFVERNDLQNKLSETNRKLQKQKNAEDKFLQQAVGFTVATDLEEFMVKQDRGLDDFLGGRDTNGLILAEELGDDFLTESLTGTQFKALLDALLLNPVTFKRSVLPFLIEEKKPQLFKSTDPENLELARQKFYESTEADISMHNLSMTIKGDPFWLEYYLTPTQSRKHFGENNSSEEHKSFLSTLNGLNYFTLVVNKADGVDQFDNVKIDTLEIFLYMVRSTVNVFSGGQFTQTFDAVRIPVPESFQDIPKIEAVQIAEDIDAFGGLGEEVGSGGLSTLLDGKDGLGDGTGGGDNVDLGDGTGGNGIANTPSEINFQGDLVDPLLSNLTGEGLQALLDSLNGEGGTSENADYVLGQFAANYGIGLDDIPEELHDIYTQVMVTAAQISGNDPTDFGFTEEQVANAISTSPGEITTDIADSIIFGDNALNDSPVTVGIPSANSERDIVIPTDTLTNSEMNTVNNKSNQIKEIMDGKNYEDLNENERKRVNELSSEIKQIVDKATTGDRGSINDAAVITSTNSRLEDLQTQLDDVNTRLDGFQMTEEERQADLKLREELKQKILIEQNNTPPVVVDEIIQPINPDTGEPGVGVSYKPRVPMDNPIILPKPPGELPNPSIDNGDGTITVPVSTLSGDVITVDQGVKDQLNGASSLYNDIMDTIETLPYENVERTFTYPDGTVETWVEPIRDFSQMPPTITYTDANGETQTLNTSDLPLPTGESITMNTVNDIILSVSDLYPDVVAGKRKSVDPDNPGGPLRTEIGALSFAPKEINEESE